MTESKPSYSLFVGIDIASSSATVSCEQPGHRPSRPFTIAQTAAGYSLLLDLLSATQVLAAATLVVLEATGTYWVAPDTFLAQHGYAISVINPAQAHAFAKALLKRAKTDTIDAQILAELALRLQPNSWTPPPAVYDELQQRLAQRDALVDLCEQLRNQHHALVQQPVVIASVQERMVALIATITAQITAVEAESSRLSRWMGLGRKQPPACKPLRAWGC